MNIKQFKRVLTIGVWFVALLVGRLASAQIPCRYAVEYLPNPAPCPSWDRFIGATGISPNGRYVCGWIDDCNVGEYAVVVDTQGMQMTILPRPAGVTRMRATGVNDLKEVCGTMELSPPTYLARGFLWRNRQVTDLGVPPGAWRVEANAINNKTEITGIWCCSPGNQAYLWRAGVFTTLELPYSSGYGLDIDEESRIVGWMSPPGTGPYEAFLWSKSGVMSLGNLPGGTMIWPHSIAPNGDVAGRATVPDPDAPSGFSHRAFLHRNGQMLNLGLLPGATESEASGTNGVTTVGGCGLVNDSAAFVFTNGAMRWLEILQPNAGLHIYTSSAISASGSITATGEIAGMHYGLVFRPICAPVGDITLDCHVNVSDLLAVINSWGPCGSNPFCPADLDGNGAVNHFDLLIVLQNWGQSS